MFQSPGFSSGSVVENLPANPGDSGSIPELGRSPGEGNGDPLQYSCLGNPTDKRNLVDCDPQDRRVEYNLVTKHEYVPKAQAECVCMCVCVFGENEKCLARLYCGV